MGTWIRNAGNVPYTLTSGYTHTLMAQVPSPGTVQRIRWGVSFVGWGRQTLDPNVWMQQLAGIGVYSQPQGGSSPPLGPLQQPVDVAPPAARWLWVEVRSFRPRSLGGGAMESVLWWEDVPPVEPTDIKAMVAIPGGATYTRIYLGIQLNTTPGVDFGISYNWWSNVLYD